MKNKIVIKFILLLIVVLIFPLITMAAWWNPFSWNWGNIFSIIFENQTLNDTNDFLSTKTILTEDDNLLIEEEEIESLEFVGKNGLLQQEDLEIVEQSEKHAGVNSIQPKAESLTLEESQSMGAQSIAPTQPLVAEENFYHQLLSLYNNKIDFLDDKINGWELVNFARDLNIKGMEEDITFCEEITANSGYDTSYATDIYKLEINEGYKFFKIWQDRINQYKEIKTKIEEQLSSIMENSFISEAEYLLRKKEIDTLVDKDSIKEEDDLIDSKVYFTSDKIAELDEKILSRAEYDKDKQKEELDNLRAEIDELDKQILHDQVEIMKANLKALEIVKQPMEIHCQTSNNGYGKMTTTCKDFYSEESIRCETVTNIYGKATTVCGENLLGY